MRTFIEKNNNNNIKHIMLNLEGHNFLQYDASSKEIIAFLTQQELNRKINQRADMAD
jgi:hypothetical protein